MEEPRRGQASDSTRRFGLRGRATRAFVAGYIRKLSERSDGGVPRATPVTESAPKEA